MPREKYEPPNPRRAYTIMTPDEIAAANNKKQLANNDHSKSSYGWYELEITGSVKNLSPDLFQLSHLSVLYLNDNNLSMVPPEITRLSNLMYLDLSSNKLRSLPPEIGDLIKLRELHLNHNYIRTLPLELGRLFQLVALGLKGNPLAPEILHIYSEANGTSKLLTYLLDNLMMIACHGSQQGSVDNSAVGGGGGFGAKNVGSNSNNNNTFVPSLLQDPIPPRPFIPISVAKQRVLLQARERERQALDYKKAHANPDGSDGFYSTGRMNYISAFTNSTDGDSPMGTKNEGGRGNGKKPDFFAIADREDRDGIIDTPNDDSSGSERGVTEAPLFLGPESMRLKAAQRLEQSLKMADSCLTSTPSSISSSSSSSGSDSCTSNTDSSDSSDFAMDSDSSAAAAVKAKDSVVLQDGVGSGPPRPDKASNTLDKVATVKKRAGRRHKAAKKDKDAGANVDNFENNNTFTIMCYNILCDKYATRQLYGYCPTWAMAWDYRRELIRRQLESYSADILCLQEVETDQYHTFFLPQLRLLGYEGIFAPKSRAKTMREDERRYVDGCAIFYQTRKFEMVRSHVVEFNQVAIAKAEGSENMLNRVMTKDNIGLTALLRTVPSPKLFTAETASMDKTTEGAITSTKGGTLKGCTLSGAKDDLSLLDLMSPGGPDSVALKAQDRVKSMGHVEAVEITAKNGEDGQAGGLEKLRARPDGRHKRRLSDTPASSGGSDLVSKTEPATIGSITSLPLEVGETSAQIDVKSQKIKRSASTLGQTGPIVESEGKISSTPSNPATKSGSASRTGRARKNARSNSDRAQRFRPKLLVVSTAHIHWDPEYSDVKIIQAMMIVHELKHFIRECYETYCLKRRAAPKDKAKHKKACASEADKAPSCEHIAQLVKESGGAGGGVVDKTAPLSDTDTLPKSKIRATLKGAAAKKHAGKGGSPYKGNNLIPLVLCGDLNSLPDSGVLEFLLTGRIEVNHADFKDLGYKACLAKLTCDLGDTGHYTHSFKLASAYKPDMMPYTNFTYDFCGVLDYILHSKKFLEARALLGPLDQEWISRNKIVGAPHPNIPSDHFPIMVEYSFKEKPTNSRPSTNMDFTA